MMSAPPRRHRRAVHAYELPRATRFSDDREMRDPEWLIRQMQSFPELWNELERETTDPHTFEKRKTGRKHVVGRDRIEGHWVLAASAWIVSKQTDIQAFYDANYKHSFWQAAGFDPERMPSYTTTYKRLIELGDYQEGIDNARRRLWHLACHRDPRVARHVHIDATAVEAHARMRHECTDPAWCAANGGVQMPGWVERLDVGNANTQRQKQNQEAPTPEEEATTTEADEETAVLDEDVVASTDPWDDLEELALEELADDEPDEPRHPKYQQRARSQQSAAGPKELWVAKKEGGPKHRYTTRDVDAGFRLYSDRRTGRRVRAWLGFLKMRAVDDYTGAEIASLHIPADHPESRHFIALIERVRETLGFYPEVVLCDKGPNIRGVRRACERRGIGMIAPFRKPNGATPKRSDIRQPGIVDEYGYCFCDYCGSPGHGHRYKRRNGRGYVTYRCANPHTRKCRTELQSKPCDTEPLVLGVLSHEDELYWELRNAGKPHEKAHRVARARYTTGANNVDTRPKRPGIPFLELRSSLSHLVEVFRLCIRQGWLDPRHPNARPGQPRQRPGGKKGLEVMRRLRRLAGLLLPQGRAAEKLKLRWDGELPDGWVPIKQRRKEARARSAGGGGAPPPPTADDDPPF
jgi:hypothetical protein